MRPSAKCSVTDAFVVGYGNDLRSDDGAGRWVADQIEARRLPGVAVRSTVGTGEGLEESLEVDDSVVFEATGMEGSAKGTADGALFRCDAVDGLGSLNDCAGASGNVCLISRGDITFAEKVQECESQGGVAAVIFNNADALFSGTMGGVATGIPSVGVSGEDGTKLLSMIGDSAKVTVDVGSYAYYDGTSMATPHVSGVAALVWSQDTSCTNDEIRNALAGTAIDLGPAGRDNAYGYGLVQASAAVKAIKGESGPDLQCGGGGGDGGDDPEPSGPRVVELATVPGWVADINELVEGSVEAVGQTYDSGHLSWPPYIAARA